jgi:hypothetical protein
MLIISLLATCSLGIALWAASRMHRNKVDAFLQRRLPPDQSTLRAAANFGALETAVVGTTVFDVLYNTARFDPFVLAGISHLHHAQDFQNLGDLITYMKENIITSEPGQAAWRQMIHKYKGYTGEQIAADHLEASGHVVSLPKSGTQPGFDLSSAGPEIDGEINVKVTDDPAYIQQHLDKQPDIPVYTNAEMSDAFADHPQVIIDPNLSVQEAFHSTSEAFAGIDALGDYIDAVPFVTLGIATFKHGRGVVEGRKSLGDAAELVALDTAGVGIGGLVGAKVGLGIGVALAPVTGGASAVVIPALVTLAGTALGVVTGKGLTGYFKQRHLRVLIKNTHAAATDFYNSFEQGFVSLVEKAKLPFLKLERGFEFNYRHTQGVLRRLLFPSVMTVFYSRASEKAREDANHVEVEYNRVMIEAKGKSERYESGLALYSYGLGLLLGDSALGQGWRRVHRLLEETRIERARIS